MSKDEQVVTATVVEKKEKKEKKDKKEKREKGETTDGAELSKEEKKAQKAARKAEKEAKKAEKGKEMETAVDGTVDVAVTAPEPLTEDAKEETKEERKARKALEKAAKKEKKEEGKEKKRKREPEIEPETLESKASGEPSTSAGAGAEPTAVSGEATGAEGEDTNVVAKKPKKAKKSKLEKAQEKAKKDGENAAAAAAEQGEGGETTLGIFADKELSDQAKKNIYYAHLHSISQSGAGQSSKAEGSTQWKFNKAKQNWLMRNVLSLEEVPERYVDLVLGYLKTTQGSSRSSLIDTANKVINPPAPEPTAKPDTTQPQEDSTAAPVAGGEPSADVEMAAGGEAAQAEATAIQTDAKADEDKKKKERAQKLLDAMA